MSNKEVIYFEKANFKVMIWLFSAVSCRKPEIPTKETNLLKQCFKRFQRHLY